MRTGRTHGKRGTYQAGCRCADCREANRLYQQAATARRSQDPRLADVAGHGSSSTYKNYLCRCTKCRAANAAEVRGRQARQGGSR